MSNELELAKLKIAELEEKLKEVNTPKQESAIEGRLTTALTRLDALETKYKKPEEKEPAAAEEERGNQCPECGGELFDIEDGLLECSVCGEQWEDENEDEDEDEDK